MASHSFTACFSSAVAKKSDGATMSDGTAGTSVVGRPPARMDPADYVHGRIRSEEEAEVEATVERAAEAARLCVELGAPKAMNQVNRRARAAE